MSEGKNRQRRAPGDERETGSGQRRRRVGELIRHELAQLLRDGRCRDPALRQANITVTEVRISPDLRSATAYVMPLGGVNVAEIIAGLKRGTPFMRACLARELPLRYAPNLVFALDETFDRAGRISAVLARPEVARDLDPQTDGDENGDDAG